MRGDLAEGAVALDFGDDLVQEDGRDDDAGAGAVRGGEGHGDEGELHFWIFVCGYVYNIATS